MVKHYHGDDADLGLLSAAVSKAFEGMTVEAFARRGRRVVRRRATHPVLKRPYLTCGFVPMVELLRYLEANGFTTYIASGGDRDFMRPFAEALYGIPPERVIGSALGLDVRRVRRRHRPALQVEDRVLRRRTGEAGADLEPARPPTAVAGGNSNGDIQMMRFASTDDRAGLRLLVLHDDADREFDYVDGAEDALARAAEHGWTVVSMRDDWSRVFADT